MKRNYIKPEAEKISFNYRDQVVAASSTESGNSSTSGNNLMGIGSPICGDGGVFDRLLDFIGSNLCS